MNIVLHNSAGSLTELVNYCIKGNKIHNRRKINNRQGLTFKI